MCCDLCLVQTTDHRPEFKVGVSQDFGFNETKSDYAQNS